MYVPGITPRLSPRKGGGGRGGGSSRGSTSGSSSSGSHDSSIPVTGATVGRSSVVSYGSGSKRVVTIPSGQPFAGRTSGGGDRSTIYGTPFYGSGYPGISGLGVANRGFPFVFWPIVWGGGLGYGAAYLYDHEYGDPNNSSRPGGPMAQAAFSSNSTNPTSNTFHILSDNTTLIALISSISTNCSQNLASNYTQTPVPFNGLPMEPLPEQAIQYYRASSVVLTLDGYNNTAALTGNENATNAPLPPNIDANLLNCLNATIGESVPLFSHAALSFSVPSWGFILAYLLWCLPSLFFQ